MKYFRVKPEADQKYINPRVHDANIYVKDSLYTESEVKRYNLNRNYLEEVTIKKTQTFWMFGARFAVEGI